MGEINVKEIMYRVLHAIAIYMYIMGIEFFRLAISRNKCLDMMQCIPSELMGQKSSANIVVNGSSLSGDFVIFFKI